MSQFNKLALGAASEAAEILGGDNPPEDIASLRAALTNALSRIQQLENRNPPESGKRTKHCTVRMNVTLHAFVRDTAKRQGLSVTDVIIMALENYREDIGQ